MFSGLVPLQHAVDVSALQHRTIADNIANVDTPHFKSKEVDFKRTLQKAMAQNGSLKAYQTNEKHIPFQSHSGLPVQVTQRPNMIMNHNGNSVDLDYEMNQLAQNQIQYQALVDRVNGAFTKLHTVISEGR